MWKIGLTGSIAMGKSTVAAMFTQNNCAHFDADGEVHALYSGEALPWFKQHFPDCVDETQVNREKLSAHLKTKPDDLKQIEAYIHPLLWSKKQAVYTQAKANNTIAIIYDIPILFETGQQKTVDLRVTVSAGEATQRARALSRPNMTEEKFEFIKARQWADSKKRQSSHVIINTDCTLHETQKQVITLLQLLKGR
jgi:dephospho-CoA kinase